MLIAEAFVNHSFFQHTTHCLSGIKMWEVKFSLGRRSQDSEEGKPKRLSPKGSRVGKIILPAEAERVTWQKRVKKTQ